MVINAEASRSSVIADDIKIELSRFIASRSDNICKKYMGLHLH